MAAIEIVKGDITKLKDVEAIVNAANSSLLGGGGVDGAIHRAAGPGLLDECRRLGGCPTGEVRITKGYNLAAKYVIHTVGPVWRGGGFGEKALLRKCYFNSLALAEENGVKSIAFPSISTGVYRFPIGQAAPIALSTVKNFLDTRNSGIERVVFVLFSQGDFLVYQQVFKQVFATF